MSTRFPAMIVLGVTISAFATWYLTSSSNILPSNSIVRDALVSELQACIDRSRGITDALIACSSAELDRKTMEMYHAFQTSLNYTSETQRLKKFSEQARWDRDSLRRCRNDERYLAEGGGTKASGSMSKLYFVQCMQREVMERTDLIEANPGATRPAPSNSPLT